MLITILTICPEYFGDFLNSHVVKRAAELGLASVEIVDIRDYAGGSFRHVDDSPYGGGPGLILRAQPVLDALRTVKTGPSHTVLLSPKGTRYDQKTARRLSGEEHLILLCGHYEGIDARVEPFADEMISLGDYILSGGEPAAIVIADSVLRLLPGNLKEGSAEEESFENGLLEYPQYTRPEEVEGMRVPEVLLSGDHAAIKKWRQEESVRITRERRPDLIENG
ncbi:MAG: tRNA (guanosine(37)-N1)-methyltransferase TrmD [Lachnospiraceae bacterium]|nr:tRNA (guanosine(37)-N1)-methyltransferase TrmD [Lachnospiraceae bacterium]